MYDATQFHKLPPGACFTDSAWAMPATAPHDHAAYGAQWGKLRESLAKIRNSRLQQKP
jgi:hypothetical protein